MRSLPRSVIKAGSRAADVAHPSRDLSKPNHALASTKNMALRQIRCPVIRKRLSLQPEAPGHSRVVV